jgi:ribosomal protein S18 acetylase RimI-like enzyme
MGNDDYDLWLPNLVAGYAEENARVKNWPAEGSLERSKNEVEALLPQGIHTEGNHLYTIIDGRTSEKVGYLWARVYDQSGAKLGFVLDLEIDERHRRKGYARAAMLALEEEAESWGVVRLGLHVFAHNVAARRLYESLGYLITGRNMAKEL